MKLAEFSVGMTVYSKAGYEFLVVSIDPKNKYPILAQSVRSGTTGRFQISSLTRAKPRR